MEKITKKDILEVIKDVPAEDFLPFMYTNGKDKCCTLGHYSRLTSKDPNDYSISNCNYLNNFSTNLILEIEAVNNRNPKSIKETVITFLNE